MEKLINNEDEMMLIMRKEINTNNQVKNRLGETNINAFGSKMTIIEYNSAKDIKVQFDNKYILKTKYRLFEKGQIRSPYCRTFLGVGYLGEGKYKPRLDEKHMSRQYKSWGHILERCYDPKYQEKKPPYIGCAVAEEWHCFQTYATWWDENYYKIEGQIMCIDKDIISKGNKIYSPEKCVFVPNNINCLFTRTDALRGNLPIGVTFNEKSKRYSAICSDSTSGKKKHVSLGTYNTPEEAFYIGYKPYKEKLIKKIADIYKSQIPQRLYDAMYRYKVEITD